MTTLPIQDDLLHGRPGDEGVPAGAGGNGET